MNAGRKVLEALIVYSKIEVKHDQGGSKKVESHEESKKAPSYLDFNADAL